MSQSVIVSTEMKKKCKDNGQTNNMSQSKNIQTFANGSSLKSNCSLKNSRRQFIFIQNLKLRRAVHMSVHIHVCTLSVSPYMQSSDV